MADPIPEKHQNDDLFESDSDDDIPLSKLKPSRAAAAAAAASDSDSAFTPAPSRGRRKRKVVSYNEESASDGEESDFEEPQQKRARKRRTPAKKATSTRKRSTSAKKKTPAKRKTPAKKKAVKVPKARTEAQLLDMAMKAHKWWEEEGKRSVEWDTLEHRGVRFPPRYAPHGVKMLYDGEPVELTPPQEEVATFYAAMDPEGPQLSTAKIATIFNKNFFRDFKKVLGRGHVVKAFSKCDFSPIRAHLLAQTAARKAMSKEEKAEAKVERDRDAASTAYAVIDGRLQKVGNSMTEPPGLFRGRGVHPRTGTVKQRVYPEQVTINVGRGDAVPPCPMPGHAWGDVIHNDTVTWLAFWHENVMNGTKYVYLAASSGFKGKSDRDKFEKARRLKGYIARIRRDYEGNLSASSADTATRQCATAMWVVDRLALRVGNEKDEDEADTVGCCSLRVEHLTLQPPATLVLDFLGKDSMRHHQSIDLAAYGAVGKKVYANLKRFTKGKKPKAEVFDQLSTSDLNRHLKSLMPGLSAKVFRTYNASVTLEAELPHTIAQALTPREQLLIYNAANRQVAILCNHQKTVTKAFEAGFAKMEDRLQLLDSQIAELKEMRARVKAGKPLKLSKVDPKTVSADERRAISHLYRTQPTLASISKRLVTFTTRRNSHKLQMRNKDDNKSVALSTSKINYMDPRITVAWCKRNEVPIETVFAATLRDKFPWAMTASPDYKF